MNTAFTKEERNEALDFAYAMGLKRPVINETEIETAMDFAKAMGLNTATANTKIRRRQHKGKGSMAPQLSFI